MSIALERPIRVVFFGGPYLQPGAQRFVAMLEEHPGVDLVLGVCEGEGRGFGPRFRNLWRRRGVAALPVMAADVVGECRSYLHNPTEARNRSRATARALAKFTTVPDLHAPTVLECVRAARPDLGVIYGAPILRPELFGIPPLGTLGIHHGRVPQYRGRKTTFWEMYNGERSAGITIQRVNPGIDTGDVVRTAEVEIGDKTYGRVWSEVEDLGCRVYLEAILAMKRGEVRFVPQDVGLPRGPLYRQPKIGDILQFWLRRSTGRASATAKTRS